MKRLLLFAGLIGLLLLGRPPTISTTHWVFPSLDLFSVPVSATYLPTPYKSVQLRSKTLASAGTNNDTITSVNTTYSYLVTMGFTYDVSSAFNSPACFLTSATNVACKDDPGSASATGIMNYAVVELYPGIAKSIQACTITIANTATTGTCTITSVSTTKTFLSYMGYRSTDSNGATTSQSARVVQTNATTLTATRIGSVGAGEVSVFIVEGK